MVLQGGDIVKIGHNVYVKLDENNYITQIGSSVFITDFENWTLVEENVLGDRGAHAQSQYLAKGLTDNQGRYNYKLVDGETVEVSEDEKPTIKTTKPITTEERLNALEAAMLEMVLGGTA